VLTASIRGYSAGVYEPGDKDLAVVEPDEGATFATKLMFTPVRMVSRRVAPRLSRRLFDRLWRIVDAHEPPPRAEEQDGSVRKLAIALALEGACTAIVTGLVDHAARRQFERVTGRWPGRRNRE
jgi:Protein of unknown function (DUF4235)